MNKITHKDTILYNTDQILNRKKGTWFNIEKDGKIKTTNSLIGKIWIVIVNKITRGSINKKINNSINDVLEDINKEINNKNNTDIKDIKIYQSKVYSLISKISKLNKKLYSHKNIKTLENTLQQKTLTCIKNISEEQYNDKTLINEICGIVKKHLLSTKGSKEIETAGFHKKRITQIKSSHPDLKIIDQIDRIMKKPCKYQAKKGLNKYKPTLIGDGASGTYILQNNTNKETGVFKPSNQEPGSEKNPKKSKDRTKERTGIPAGQGFTREILAYKLDKGFADVPPTYKLKIKSIKNKKLPYDEGDVGSLQEFVDNTKSASSIKPKERRLFLKEDVHKIAIQDIRMLNADRHLGNILVDENNRLVPIDHGLCFPENARRLVYSWMTLPQSEWPMNPEDLEHIRNIDIDKEESIMRKNGLGEPAIKRAVIATFLLKKGAEAGLSPYQIGQIMLTGTQVENSKIWHTRWTTDSYFETVICKEILKEFQPIDVVLDELISSYKMNHNITNEFEQLFSKSGWMQKPIGNGLNLFQFEGKMFEGNQKISVLRLTNPSHVDSQYQLRVINSHKAIRHAEDDPKIELSKAVEKIPGTIALVNGGYFHYNKDYYPWPEEDKFEIGDPVGALMVNGNCVSVNPEKPLWGMVKIFQDRHCKISENGMEDKNIKEILGAAPILIKNGSRTDLHSKTLEVGAKVFARCPPGRFVDHIHNKNSRSLIGTKSDGTTFLITVESSRLKIDGMTGDDLGELMSSLGVTDALNLDGGGSTQMVLKDSEDSSIQWIATTKDLRKTERSTATALAIVDKSKFSDSWEEKIEIEQSKPTITSTLFPIIDTKNLRSVK